MKKNHFIKLLFLLIITFSCSNDDLVSEPILEASGIALNFSALDILSQKTISITFEKDVTIDSIRILVDNVIEKRMYTPPYEYNLKGSNYSDGEHLFKINAYQKNNAPVSKSVKFRADNNGPFISNKRIDPNQIICDEIIFNPVIEDAVSIVKNVKFLINDIIVSEVQDTNYSFKITPNLYPEGTAELKFIMEDNAGNSSSDSIEVQIKKPLIKINLPDQFTRASVEKLIIILSDSQGNYIDSKQYNDQAETLDFCQSTIDPDTQYMLTFFEIFDNSIYNVFCYNNLSKNKIGNEITLKARPLTSAYAVINLSTNNLNLDGNIRATGQGYSMVNINDNLNGTLTTSYTNNLGSPKTLITAHNNQTNAYKWAFMEHLENVSKLEASDFTSDNVTTNSIELNTSVNHQFLKIYGFENTELMNVFSGHDLFQSKMSQISSQVYKYYFPAIFNDYFYSFSTNNYYKEGLGLPPQSLNIPELSIDFSLTGNQINFQGISNYEVGKVRLKNQPQTGVNLSNDNPSIILEFIFDGSINTIVIPTIPADLFEGDIHKIFNNAEFLPVQAIAENYVSYNSYTDYLQHVFINSNPFFLSSSSRERVFKSTMSSHILPVWEYPYFTRF